MRWISVIFLMIVGTAVLMIHPLLAKGPAPSREETSAVESFGVRKLQDRKNAPAFSLKDLNGNQVSLKEFYGKPLLIFFWASWCPACKEDLALLEKCYRRNRSQVEILTIVIDGEKEKRVKNFIKKGQITLPVLLDRKEVIARTYGITMVPTAFLINGKGVVEGIIVGQRDWCAPEAHLAIQELLIVR